MKYSATIKLLVICIALQFLQTLHPSLINYQALDPALFWHLYSLPVFLCQLIVHQISHGSWDHLIGNFMFGLPFMVYLEGRLGEDKFLKFFLLSGVGAAVAQMCMPIGAGAGLIGSSGAISGVMAGACMMVRGKSLRRLALLLLAVNVIVNMQMLSLSLLVQGVAHAAHIGGMVTGMFLTHKPRKS